ncbi:hypothetical protein ACIO52_04515 [Nocardia sp. NPDC087230]|uniref:hypothetical protein n=1 Tax=Nocardia sp. NPDC087230 TaxID=3364331 RepID=UPI00381A9EA7
MARVPWAALSGDEVEAVVSILLYNEYPRAQRIRPSQGDFGIDVIVPRSAPPHEVWDVYQVKKFATNLDSSQKTQIEKSFRRLMIGLVRKKIPVGDWYLVMPLDPTIENKLDEWFSDMPERVIADMFSEDPKLKRSAEEKDDPLTEADRAIIEEWFNQPGRIIEWKGLNACEAWISKHWYVKDYYLEGGAERLRNAIADVGKILQRDRELFDLANETSVLTPAEVAEHLGRLQRVLDGDPHFRYGVSIDPFTPSISRDEPGLVAATQLVSPDGSCLTFRIYKRFDEALAERPIPLKLHFAIEDPEFDQDAFDRWRKFGTPLDARASVEMDLPGGLGGNIDTAWVSILPSESEVREIRIRAVAPDGEELAAPVTFTVTSSIGPDRTGVRTTGSDPSGRMHTEGEFDGETASGDISFRLSRLEGAEIGDAWPAIALTAAMVYPNTIQVGGKYGPFRDIRQVSEGFQAFDLRVIEYLRALQVVQSHVAVPILIPKLDDVTFSEMWDVLHAAAMIEGRVAIAKWHPVELAPEIAVQLDSESYYELVVIGAYEFSVGEQRIELAQPTTMRMLSVRLEKLDNGRLRALPHLNDTSHHWIGDDPSPPPGQSQWFSREIQQDEAAGGTSTISELPPG